jgi:cytochrome c-type biogenesis protein CcmH/NrfG
MSQTGRSASPTGKFVVFIGAAGAIAGILTGVIDASKWYQEITGKKTPAQTTASLYQGAQQHYSENDRLRAAEGAKAVIALEPNHKEAHKLLAACYLKDGNLSGAAIECNTATHIDPDDMTAQYGLATALRGLGSYAEARDAYRVILRHPRSTPAQREEAGKYLRELGG